MNEIVDVLSYLKVDTGVSEPFLRVIFGRSKIKYIYSKNMSAFNVSVAMNCRRNGRFSSFWWPNIARSTAKWFESLVITFSGKKEPKTGLILGRSQNGANFCQFLRVSDSISAYLNFRVGILGCISNVCEFGYHTHI